MERIQVLDTHTGGEPTRVVTEIPFQLEGNSLAEMREDFAKRFDNYRKAIVCEPRGSDVIVGAILTRPTNASSVAGVIFFNNVGYLGMCGHGTIGVAVALKRLGKIGFGSFQLDTPVGTVGFDLLDQNRVSIRNVTSYRLRKDVCVELAGGRTVCGDVAWGGNWFFICDDHGLRVEQSAISELGRLSAEIRQALEAQEITGAEGAEIDHIELIGPPNDSSLADAKNYVMCPGAAYDRSPCGTGTSAKLACLAADGKLAAGEIYRQESIIGSIFEASFEAVNSSQVTCESASQILPTIVGEAHVSAQAELLLDPNDPFCMGIV